jgi:hypothetical protein
VVNLFLYNRKVSLYLKGKFLHYMNITQAWWINQCTLA